MRRSSRAIRDWRNIFEATTELCGKPKKVSNWLMVETMRLLKENDMERKISGFQPGNLAKLIDLADAGTINSSVQRKFSRKCLKTISIRKNMMEEKGLKTVNDEGALRTTIEQIIKDNPQSVEDYHNGKEKAIGFLVGQTMKAMKGKANPAMVNQILKELL